MTSSLAAVAFYAGLTAVIFGSIRLARASLERTQRRDILGIGALALGALCFALAVAMYITGPRTALPF